MRAHALRLHFRVRRPWTKPRRCSGELVGPRYQRICRHLAARRRLRLAPVRTTVSDGTVARPIPYPPAKEYSFGAPCRERLLLHWQDARGSESAYDKCSEYPDSKG